MREYSCIWVVFLMRRAREDRDGYHGWLQEESTLSLSVKVGMFWANGY